MTAPAIAALFDLLLDRGGSDLHLGIGYPSMLRVRGDLVPKGDHALSAADINALLAPLLSRDQAAQFATTGDLDFARMKSSSVEHDRRVIVRRDLPPLRSVRTERAYSNPRLIQPSRRGSERDRGNDARGPVL